MKTTIHAIPLILILILVAGCEKKSTDKTSELASRIEALELSVGTSATAIDPTTGLPRPQLGAVSINQRVADLEAETVGLQAKVADIDDTVRGILKRDAASAHFASEGSQLLIEVNNKVDALSNHVDTLTTRQAARAVTPTRPAQLQLANGIPVDIYNAIVAAAEKEYPGDYSMQAAKIRWQVEDYKKLHP